MKIELQSLSKTLNITLILSALYNEKMHGYQIVLEIDNKTNGNLKLNLGTIYPILHQLEKEGHIKGIWKQDGPKRDRKYYKITAKGKKYARKLAMEWEHFNSNLKIMTGVIE